MSDSKSAIEVKEATLKIKNNPEATRAFVTAVRAGDKASAAKILNANGASLPPHATVELEAGPITIKPEDTCFEVTVTHKENPDGSVTDTYRVRMFAC